MSGVVSGIFGNGSKAGILGTGQFTAQAAPVDKNAFYNNSGLTQDATQVQNMMNVNNATYAPKISDTQLGPTANATAATANAATVGPMQNINAATVGPASQAQAAQLNTGDANLVAGQNALVSNLQNTMNGNGPSLAANQVNQANAAGEAARLSGAASQRGFGNTGANMRELAYQQGAGNQAAAIAGGQQRIQEEQNAQANLGNALSSARGQDITTASANADLTQQAGLANAAANNQNAQFNAGQQMTAEQANQNAANAATTANAGFAQATALANQNSANAIAQGNQAAQNASTLQQGQMNQLTNDTNSANALEQTQINDTANNALMGAQIGITNQAQQNEQNYNALISGNQNAVNQANQAGFANAAAARGNLISNIGSGFGFLSDEDEKEGISDIGKSDVDKFVNFGGKTDYKQGSMPTELGSNMDSTTDAPLSSMDPTPKSAPPPTTAPNTSNTGSYFLSSAPGGNGYTYLNSNKGSGESAFKKVFSMISDEDEKKNIEEPNEEVMDFISKLGAHKYQYKHPEKDGAGYGTYVSPMAQELEKSTIGKSMVSQTSDGTKMVDYGRGFGALMAVTKNLHDRLDKLEKR